jgi:tRNA splicing endonuclease
MKEKVIFQKVKEVTTVRARWMVAFVEDNSATAIRHSFSDTQVVKPI